ncbi:DUF2330 domain-containing protein [Streptomyces sp. NBC_01591]|uniref:DUF2330 domain-containing protein n=1 Tax=Streptomyces sp. NBC_01591 TaxID=2975888 RepID=UPI002DD7F906|nr:DUF2330 domain-containing protein [Streptomyces sp. NBC_01591]WSD68271.1 DUF2330 domain-containing protein [Streptomyces sp. NBC_01591]
MVRALALLLMLVSLQLGSLISPAYACGCGAMVPSKESQVSVDRETSVVDWDGRTEQIVMRLTVRGNAPEAAWIMPVPHRASVELGDPGLFSELSVLTAPEPVTRHYFWPRSDDWPFADSGNVGDGAGAPSAGAPAVEVVGRERLGPFDVARLAATDPEALQKWLEDNGFDLPDRLATALKPYVEQKWEYVAIRLAPRGSGNPLSGTLEPLRLRFASDRLVYPMRLSKLASTPQQLGLYVLAEHRMEPSGPIGGDAPEVTYAGRIDPRSAADDTDALEGLTGADPVFLTAIEQSFPHPERIDGDHQLRATDADTPYRTKVYRNRLLTVGGIPAWVLSLLGAVLAAAAAVLLVRRARRWRPVPPPATVTVPPPLG